MAGLFVPALPGQCPGTATNDSAAAGNVGELLTVTVGVGSPITLADATGANLGSLSLTAGDWDVSCSGVFVPAATTRVYGAYTSISATSATLDLNEGNYGSLQYGAAGLVVGNNLTTVNTIPRRISLSSTTTYYCVLWAHFDTSTMQGRGLMRARRVR